LLPGSPAIDAGANSGCPATDQRGVARPYGLRCDIGAFEFNLALVLPTITSPLVATGMVDVPFSYTITATGTQPITFTVSALPPGLLFDGTVIAGIPTTSGTIPVTLTARNAAGSRPKTLALTISPPLCKI
jgi:hypothetical protein